MMRLFSVAGLLCLPVLLFACQPLPHPFEDEQLPPDAAILAMPEAYGVVVDPIADAPPKIGAAIQQAMVQSLQDQDIPAAIGIANTRSFRLSGTLAPARQAASNNDASLLWVLKDAKGTILGQYRQRLAAGRLDTSETKEAFDREAVQIASLIVTPAPVEHPNERRIYILPIENAPGDGAVSLARSLSYLISRAGYAVAENGRESNTVKVRGNVQIAPARDNQQQVKIVWHVISPSGAEIGQVAQENTVARGSLDGAWSEIAMAVASAARDDILGLASRIPSAQ